MIKSPLARSDHNNIFIFINPGAAELFSFFYIYLRLVLLMQFPASNNKNSA